MGATAASLMAGAPPPATYVLGAVTAMLLVVSHPAHAVLSPCLVHSASQLVALNAVTGWILSLGLVLAPAGAGLITHHLDTGCCLRGWRPVPPPTARTT